MPRSIKPHDDPAIKNAALVLEDVGATTPLWLFRPRLSPNSICVGASTSRAMVADVALPTIFSRLKNLWVVEDEPLRIGG